MEYTPNTVAHDRIYSESDSTCLVAAMTIAESAGDRQAAFENEDSTLTPEHFSALNKRIDDVAEYILGADNAAALRASTLELARLHAGAVVDLGFTKDIIETKFTANPIRRDELLSVLGFKAWYAAAVKGRQEKMGELLKHISQFMSGDVQEDLMSKGLTKTRIARLREYAAGYLRKDASQEGHKENRKELSLEHVAELNAIYQEIMVLCRLGKRIYKGNAAIRDRFVFNKVVRQQSSYNTGSKKADGESPAA